MDIELLDLMAGFLLENGLEPIHKWHPYLDHKTFTMTKMSYVSAKICDKFIHVHTHMETLTVNFNLRHFDVVMDESGRDWKPVLDSIRMVAPDPDSFRPVKQALLVWKNNQLLSKLFDMKVQEGRNAQFGFGKIDRPYTEWLHFVHDPEGLLHEWRVEAEEYFKYHSDLNDKGYSTG